METPNTRARRKRELEASQEESSVVWRQENPLLREFLTSEPLEQPIPLPPPTQRPRPLAAASSSSARLSGTDTHPRKRTRLRAATSIPPPSRDDMGKRLDELLDRISSGSRTCTPNTRTTSSLRTSTSTSAMASMSMGSARSARQPMSERRAVANGANPVSATRSLPPKCTSPALLSPRRAKSAAEFTTPKDVSQVFARPFRPPLLDPSKGVRSSPRRRAAITDGGPLRGQAESPTPLVRTTATVLAAPHSSKVPPSGIPPQPSQTVPPRAPSRSSISAHSVPAQNTRSTAPVLLPLPVELQPSSDGNTSIDSFDGFFECGGAEMDELFAAMDGC